MPSGSDRRERLALLGDVHGNMPALNAVLAAIEAAGITRGAVTGDLVTRGHEPEAVVRTVASLGWPTVAGNTDRRLVTRPPRSRDHPKALEVGSRPWTRNHVSRWTLNYLDRLPMVARVDLAGRRVVLVHASPRDPRKVLVDEDAKKSHLKNLARELEADCVVVGHTHRPFVREVGGVLFVNPGAVGEATGDDLRPAWAWLEADGDGLVAHLERVERPLARVR